MSIATSELQVAEGLADDLDLRSLNYGILLHRRRAVGTAVIEEFEYRALVDANSNPLQLPGIAPDDERIEFERGHGSALDRRLVRRSAFRFAPSPATGQGVGSLQEVFLVVKPKKSSTFQPALGLKWIGGPELAPKVCPPQGLPALRVWCTEEWHDRHFVEAVPYDGDIVAWAEALGRRAGDALSDAATPLDDFTVPPICADMPEPVRAGGHAIPAPVWLADAPMSLTASPPQAHPPVPIPPSTPTRPGSTRESQRGWMFGLFALCAVGAAYYLLFQPARQPQPSSSNQGERVAKVPEAAPDARALPPPVVTRKPAPAASTPSLANSEIELLAQSITVPVGNSPAERQRLFDPKGGFEQNFGYLTALLDSAQKAEQTLFDQLGVEMRSARLQAPAWPTENSVERRKFNERLADLINMAADADDARHLERSVTLSEQFLSTHFGHSTAHLNLSLALSQLGRFAEAQGPAHHAIYYNPDGINGYFALGLSLAGQKKTAYAAAAFCAALRKSRYSVKTVEFFNEVAAGRKYGRTPVVPIMAAAINQCPASSWGTNLPP